MIKTITIRIGAAALLWLMLLSYAQIGRAADGNMDLGVFYRYGNPMMDFQEFDPSNGYGFMFRYWLNDTSTIDVELEDRFLFMDIKNPGDTKKFSLRTDSVSAALVYLPKVDFIGRPALGIGVGYQQWNAESDYMTTTTAQSFVFHASLGMDFEINKLITIGPVVRFQYFPFKEDIVTEVTESTFADVTTTHKTRTNFENAAVLEGGINLTFRVK